MRSVAKNQDPWHSLLWLHVHEMLTSGIHTISLDGRKQETSSAVDAARFDSNGTVKLEDHFSSNSDSADGQLPSDNHGMGGIRSVLAQACVTGSTSFSALSVSRSPGTWASLHRTGRNDVYRIQARYTTWNKTIATQNRSCPKSQSETLQ